MKVTGQQPPRSNELNTGRAREAEQKHERHGDARADGARSEPNRTSLTMHRIKEVIRNTPDVRADRVAELRERIQSGQYRVDAERLAQNLLAESLRDDVEKP